MFAIAGVLIANFLKNIKSDYTTFIILFVSIVIISCIVSMLSSYFGTINRLIQLISVQKIYIKLLLKITGVAYIAEFSSDLCVDLGYTTIANQIKIFGKVTILMIGLPVIEAVINLLGELM
jgi:stage III sporulation protein AD